MIVNTTIAEPLKSARMFKTCDERKLRTRPCRGTMRKVLSINHEEASLVAGSTICRLTRAIAWFRTDLPRTETISKHCYICCFITQVKLTWKGNNYL